jgi:hypothetical protein
MFIRQHGSSHQVIETYREGGKVKQRVLANLGSCTTLAEAIEQWPRHIAYLAAGLALMSGRTSRISRLSTGNQPWGRVLPRGPAEPLERDLADGRHSDGDRC